MQVTYQQRLEDWIAAQVFAVEQLEGLKKANKKHFRNFAVYIAVLVFLILFFARANLWGWLAAYFLVGIILLRTFLSSRQKLLYNQLQAAYGPEFENEEDKTVDWDVSPERILVAGKKKESRFQWEGVQKIVVCPDYLFIDFGGITGWLSFPGCAVVETVYQAFCEEVIRTYREHAAKHGKLADVIHSEWALNAGKFKKKRNFSGGFYRVLFSVLWGGAFAFAGVYFISLLQFIFAMMSAINPDTESLSGSVILRAVGGPLLLGIVGLVLGLFGKLPGTRGKDQISPRKY